MLDQVLDFRLHVRKFGLFSFDLRFGFFSAFSLLLRSPSALISPGADVHSDSSPLGLSRSRLLSISPRLLRFARDYFTRSSIFSLLNGVILSAGLGLLRSLFPRLCFMRQEKPHAAVVMLVEQFGVGLARDRPLLVLARNLTANRLDLGIAQQVFSVFQHLLVVLVPFGSAFPLSLVCFGFIENSLQHIGHSRFQYLLRLISHLRRFQLCK